MAILVPWHKATVLAEFQNYPMKSKIIAGLHLFWMLLVAAWLGHDFSYKVLDAHSDSAVKAWIVVFWVIAFSLWIWLLPRMIRPKKASVWRPAGDGRY